MAQGDDIDIVYIKAGTKITVLAPKPRDGYTFLKTVNYPLVVKENPELNYIEVHYTSEKIPPETPEPIWGDQVPKPNPNKCLFYTILYMYDNVLDQKTIDVVFVKNAGLKIDSYPELLKTGYGFEKTVNFELIVDKDVEQNHIEVHYKKP